jgi:hypothetical protein
MGGGIGRRYRNFQQLALSGRSPVREKLGSSVPGTCFVTTPVLRGDVSLLVIGFSDLSLH